MRNLLHGKPIRVEVTETDWNCYSLNNRMTWRDGTLFEMLKREGGINVSVPPGTYYFNMELRGLKIYTTLEPKK